MQGIRAVYNKTIKTGFIDKNPDPFETYTSSTTSTPTPAAKRAFNVQHIHNIVNLELD